MSLSDKVKFVNKSYDFSFANSKPFYPEKDVKEAIKELKKELLPLFSEEMTGFQAELINRINEIFGDELTK